MSQELGTQAKVGRISWVAAAQQAHDVRNSTMELIRWRSTPVGRALAQKIKREGGTLSELVANKTLQLFGKEADFNRLTPTQRNQVYAAIIESAGRADPRITARMRGMSVAGRGLLIASLAFSVYAVANAENKAAAKREGAVIGAGIAGSAAGGAAAGLLCGPGAPICSTALAFVAGSLAAFGVSLALE